MTQLPPPPTETTVTCVRCGHNLTGAMIGGACPECGEPISPSYQRSLAPTSGHAITSMVLGILSIPAGLSGCACIMLGSLPGLLALPLGIAAIFFHRAAQREIAAGKAGGASANLSLVGFICGIIGTILGALSLAMLGFIAVAIIMDAAQNTSP